MHRRALAVLPLLALTRPAPAQDSRAAGRQALALAAQNRWPEAEATASRAEPLLAKTITWLRLLARTGGAGAPAIVGFGLANPDWPLPDALARRAEETLAIDPDDPLALRWFAERSPRSAEGYLRLADALARAGRPAEAETIRRIGEQGPPVPPADAARRAWASQHAEARRRLREGDARAAYATAAGHGIATPGEPRQEAEFLAGFIALTRLGDAALAERHFVRVGEGSQSVITRARSHYWQGRAAAAQGAGARARARWAAGAELPHAFYGQLAAVAIGEDGAALSARIGQVRPPAPTAAEVAAVEGREIAQVATLLTSYDEHRRARLFLLRLEELAATPGEKVAVVRLAARLGRPDHPVWVARRLGAAGVVVPAEGWPTPFPPEPAGVEPALIHAVTRQESNFEVDAVSSANARGLMQLLPGTAQMVARRLGVPHATAQLTTDPAHNMRLGSAFLEELMARFGGAMPFAVAGYNAGPGRVGEWVAAFGDPRSGAIPMLDWIELIPFNETRNYVQRVLENVAIYRARDPAAAAEPHPMSAWLAAAAGVPRRAG